MLKLPNLEKLLQKPLFLILGAGSSKDCGYPLWGQLYEELLITLERNCKVEPGVECEFWLETCRKHHDALINPNNNLSIDEVIAISFRNDVERHYIVRVLCDLIFNYERKDAENFLGIDSLWITLISNTFLSLLEQASAAKDDEYALKLLRNFKVVSLNYDRCFAHHFFPRIQSFFTTAHFHDRTFLSAYNRKLHEFFSVYQPHGTIGGLALPNQPQGNPISTVIPLCRTKYGSTNTFSLYGRKRFDSSRAATWVEVVGEGSRETAYNEINKAIPDESACVIVGVSAKGLSGCNIDWARFDGQIHYCSREQPPFEQPNLVLQPDLHYACDAAAALASGIA